MKRTALLDGDIICWKACAIAQSKINFDGEEISRPNEFLMRKVADNMVESWVKLVSADEFVFCVSDRAEGGQSFRFQVYDKYHENRKKMVRPAGLLELHWELVKKYHGMFHPGLEGDDILGILATSNAYEDPVIVSEDKDMWSLPTNVFIPTRSKGIRKVSEETANYFWFRQALIGDTADNYKGCPGIGKVKAKFVLGGARSVAALWEKTRLAFLNAGQTEEDAIQQLRLARILRASDINSEWTEIKLWHPLQPQTLQLPKPHEIPQCASQLHMF